MPHALHAYLEDRLVGTITNTASDHNIFAFAKSYEADPNRPVLSLGFHNAQRRLIQPTKTPQTRLLAFFANLLPESHLREYLAKRAGVNPQRDFPLLWLLGLDLPGAVVVRHGEGSALPASEEDEPPIPREIEDDPSMLRFSLAGVALKFSAIAEAAGGLSIPAHGLGGGWILKMPSPIYENVPENEFSMMTFARSVGIEVPTLRLVSLDQVAHLPSDVRRDLGQALAVERFDRSPSGRIHIEDFNQIAGQYPEEKYRGVSYDAMLRNIWAIMGEDAAREFVRRLIFSIGIGNGDMHLKNWSVIYRDGRTPELAPAYDYVSTVAYIENEVLALSLARSKQWSDVSYDHLERFARKAGVPRGLVLEASRETAHRMLEVWPKIRGELELRSSMRERINEHMARVPIFSGSRP